MTRIKRGVLKRKKHKKVLKQTKGYYSSQQPKLQACKGRLFKAMAYSYRDRKNKKRTFRSLWIVRINAAARSNGITYNELINGLKMANVEINRKMLSDIAVNDPGAFQKIAEIAKKQISA